MKKNQFNIIIPVDMKPYPDRYEERIARVLAGKFQSDVLFVVRSSLHTPDIQIVKTGDYWEIKNIKGNGKNTIEDNLKRAAKQSKNVVIGLFRTKMTPVQASTRIQYFLKRPHRGIQRVILVTKNGAVIDFCG